MGEILCFFGTILLDDGYKSAVVRNAGRNRDSDSPVEECHRTGLEAVYTVECQPPSPATGGLRVTEDVWNIATAFAPR
jgi:hypothetical protein